MVEDTWIRPNVEEFSEDCTWLPIHSMTHVHPRYDQQVFHKDSRDCMVFRTTPAMYRLTRLVHGASNLVSAFLRVIWKILQTYM